MLEDLILPDHLKTLAGTAAFKRGEAYFREGRVELMVDEVDRVAGAVEGSGAKPYRAQIEARDNELAWDCTCPVGDRGEFCKHLVALARTRLASGDEPLWVPPDEEAHASKPVRGKRRGKEEEIRAFLEDQEKARLVDWLLEVARGDRATRERLLLAARADGPASEFRKLVTDVTRVRGFLDYHDMPDFARRVHGMIDALEGLRGEALMELAGYAVDRLHKVLEVCDDSDGYMSELLGRLVNLHVRASVEAKPEPTGFARWLFERQMSDAWSTWPSPEAYLDALGKPGMVAYARLARTVWDSLPALRPGDTRRGGDRYTITHIMESLAKMTGEPDDLVEVIERDLSVSYAFLRIAEIFHGAGRHDEAMDWAERGLAAFPKDPDWRLQDFLVDEYFRRKRPDEAMTLAWSQFGRGMGVNSYKTLMQRARRTDRAVDWRTRALAALREAAVRHHEHFRPLFGPRPKHPDFTTLVQALLWDKDLDTALAEANAGLCSAHVLAALARALAPSRPEEAIILYKRALHPIVDQRRNDAYAEGTELMRAVRDLLRGLGREREFGDWLAEVRLAHKPKRNFMKLLDAL